MIFFMKYINLYTFYPKITPPPPFGSGGHKIYNLLFPYPKNATYQIWLRLAQYILRRRC